MHQNPSLSLWPCWGVYYGPTMLLIFHGFSLFTNSPIQWDSIWWEFQILCANYEERKIPVDRWDDAYGAKIYIIPLSKKTRCHEHLLLLFQCFCSSTAVEGHLHLPRKSTTHTQTYTVYTKHTDTHITHTQTHIYIHPKTASSKRTHKVVGFPNPLAPGIYVSWGTRLIQRRTWTIRRTKDTFHT